MVGRVTPPSTPRISQGSPEATEPIEDTPKRSPSVYSPQPRGLGELPLEEAPSEVKETAEKTNSLIDWWLQGCLLSFAAVLLNYSYRFYKERKISLIFPCVGWSVAAYLGGYVGGILHAAIKEENPAIASPPKQAGRDYIPGQPIPIFNAGNHAFVNAPLQAIGNDIHLMRAFKKICTDEVARHGAFKIFLESFPPPDSGYKKINAFFKAIFTPVTRAVVPYQNEQIPDIVMMLARRRNDLDQLIEDKYPLLTAAMNGEFDSGPLREEFDRMKGDQRLLQFFYQQRDLVNQELLGFQAYQDVLAAYEGAVKHKPHYVSFEGRWRSSKIGNIEKLFKKPEVFYHVKEFIQCLFKYTPPQESCFRQEIQKEWMECSENPASLPVVRTTVERSYFDGFLKIDQTLTKGDVIEDLLAAMLEGGPTDETKVFEDGPAVFKCKKWTLFPERFILELKRFEEPGDPPKYEIKKNDVAVVVGEVMELGGRQYRLKSVIEHIGSLEGGHYRTVLKKGNQWWVACDHQVYRDIEREIEEGIISEKETALAKGYLYFYELEQPMHKPDDVLIS